MKPRLIFFVSLIATFAIAQEHLPLPQYTITALGTLGGTFSSSQGINNRGWMAGDANLAGDQTEHAVFWKSGRMIDLGTLGGLNSVAGAINEGGLITGIGQTSTVDPLGENWGGIFACSPTGGGCDGYQNLVLGFIWRNGVMIQLPTLGGNNAYVGSDCCGINNRGQVVGLAETATQDSNCIAPQVLDWEAVIWGPSPDEIHELPPLPGDSVAAALSINDNGQIVGGSAPICGSPNFGLSAHAVLWQDGSVLDLGSLGGTVSNIAVAINNVGQVVGLSNLSGDMTTHAFLWQQGVMMDLGTLPGDFASFAYGINDRGQIVGQSIDQDGNSRGFLWQNGVMTDLNTLMPSGSPLYIVQPDSINSRGEIVGIAFDESTGQTPAFLAIPKTARSTVVASEAHGRENISLPENVRQFLRKRRDWGPH